jgi:hypothetical protein
LSFSAIAIENYRSPSNPLGVKGASEGAIIPIGGLMANAVGNALVSFGAMPNQLPRSPARVLANEFGQIIRPKLRMTADCFGNSHAAFIAPGPKVRIRFPPPASLRTLGPSGKRR